MTSDELKAAAMRECPCCNRLSPDVKSRRRNTIYADDSMNFLESCQECWDNDNEHWEEMWSDYYAGRL